MVNTTAKKIRPSSYTLALGVLILLFGIFALITTGSQIYISLGIFVFGAGFLGYIFQNDVFDITLGVLTALAVLMFGLYQVQSHFFAEPHHSGAAVHPKE